MTQALHSPNLAARRVRAMAALLLASVLGAGAFDARLAGARESDLVTTRIDDAVRTPLPGHGVRWARAANDRGAVPADLALTRLTLNLKRSQERQRAFDAYLLEQRDPTSPNYQRWLTASEIGERFGASRHDIDAISDWLGAQGLTVEAVSNSRMQIRFSGSADAVAAAFGTELRYFEVAGEKRMAPVSELQIPAALKDVAGGVLGLSPVRFVPQHRIGVTATSAAVDTAAQPAMSNCNGGTCNHFVTPGDFSKIYGIAGAPSTQGLTGAGQTIAILGRARVSNADLQNFAARTNTTLKTPAVVVPPDGADPGPAETTCSQTGTPSCSNPSDLVQDQAEATLDVTRAGSVAPGADLVLVISGARDNRDGLNYVLDYVIDHEPLLANIVSISFGSCEANNSPSVANYLDQLFAQGAMQGQSIFVSSGDAGAADCADYFTAPAAGLSRSINVICSSGHVTCVGGTSFASGTDQYWNSTNSAGYVSATGYIPEGAWNEPLDDDGNPQVAATGGGVSIYIDKPTWQNGPGVPANQKRNVPDASFGASTTNGYFGCMAARNASCEIGSDNRFSFLAWGGTSASAPSLAGVAALLNQSRGAAQGNLNPTLYALGANPGNGVFHDVTVQSSGVSGCAIGTASLCNNSLPSPSGLSGGLEGYAVGTGYDLATGIGSIDVGNLIALWGGSSTGVNLNQHGLTGSWADLSTDNQGLLVEVYPDFYGPGRGMLFGGWFTFDVTVAGGPRWYTLLGEVASDASSATLPITLTTGGRFDSPQATTGVTVGEATLQLSDCANGKLDYSFSDGSNRTGSLTLTRIDANVTCGPAGNSGAPASNFPLSGAWADTGNSGQGLVLDINPIQNVFFAAWYTFASNGQSGASPASQRWFTLQASMTPGVTSLDGVPIYAVGGGVFDQPADTTVDAVGHANIVFHSCNSATLDYAFDSGSGFPSSGTLNLSRVGPVPAGCPL